MTIRERIDRCADSLAPAEREYYEERAAVREYDGQEWREMAEWGAYKETVEARATGQFEGQ